MTTIITTTGSNSATLVSDRGITSDLIHPDMRKIVQQKTWLIGCAGSDRGCDVLQYSVKYPVPPKSLLGKTKDEWFGWVVVNVVPRIAQAIKDSGLNEYDGEAILVTHGKSFYISSTLGVLNADPYWAIGSGAQLAIGALAEYQYNSEWNKNHDLMAKQAGGIASMHDPFTRGSLDLWVSHHTGLAFQQ
jgi:ATP-dependent protease HslVU (ClpYQ) peptidase subunit